MRPPLSQTAKGKWPSILPRLGIPADFLTGRYGPCPACAPGGAGTDRFRFDNKDGRGSWYCSQCGAGDGIELVKRVNGWDFKEAAQEIEKHLGTAPIVAIRQGRSEADVRAEMNSIWKSSKPLEEVPEAALWWIGRTGAVPTSPDLRAVRALRCPGARDFPAMVAMVRVAEGRGANLHRTFLGPDGGKADVPEPRRVMDITMPKGCAIRLAPHADVLGVAEGIETAESCQRMFGVPTWALLSAQNMRGFVPPSGLRKLVIFGDHDLSFTGQAAAFDLARSCWARRKSYEPPLEVEVRINGVSADPAHLNLDWNDEWRVEMAKRSETSHAENAA